MVEDRHPVAIAVRDDDLRRSRLTVLFRVLLAIPHLVWLLLWTIAALVALVFGWFAALVLGRLPDGLHRFLGAYLRYATHLSAYVFLVANPYPGFTGTPETYPVDLELPAPQEQSRWRTLFRGVLAVPALLLASVVGVTYAPRGRTDEGTGGGGSPSGMLVVVGFLGWFAALVTGRMPRGLRDAGVYGVGYRAQAFAYALLLTDRYPTADPKHLLASLAPPDQHPVRLVVDDDRRRSRVTVLFRVLLAIPHFLWLALWSIAAVAAVVVQWFVTLAAARPASAIHRFLSSYVRYATHLYAFLYLTANPFPGFTGDPTRYPVSPVLPGPERQSRWKTLFRLPLAVPAVFVSSTLGVAGLVAAIFMWFVSLVKGEAPEGLRNLSAYTVRYAAQLSAYLALLTDAYPHASPLEGVAREPGPAGASDPGVAPEPAPGPPPSSEPAGGRERPGASGDPGNA